MGRPRIFCDEVRSCERCGTPMRFRDARQSLVRFKARKFCSPACARNASTPFWERVEKSASGCWEWTGKVNWKGYGVLEHEGRYWRAHRLAYTLAKGEIPLGKMILHSCDNRRCCNPDHLRPGTNLENVADAIARNRRPGLNNARCITIPADQLFDGPICVVAARHGVSSATVWRLRQRQPGARRA